MLHTLSVEDVVKQCLTFDDVLLVPRYVQNVKSRLDPRLNTSIGSVKLDVPIISANMSTITELNMMVAMADAGCLGILHRFLPIEQQRDVVVKARSKGLQDVAVSIGVSPGYLADTELLIKAGANVVCVDVAHGDSAKVIEVVKTIRKEFPSMTVIAGNIATPSAALRLASAGAKVLKIGIGPGSLCITRSVAGCGVPQLAAIAAISLTLKNAGGFDDVTLIADGGIRTTGDIIKALAVGADAVMIGRLFAGTDEAPLSGKYFGMASKEAGRIKENIAPEGTVTSVAPQGSVSDVVASIKAGLQTAMSYQDALTLEDLRQDPQFVRVTMAGLAESGVRL